MPFEAFWWDEKTRQKDITKNLAHAVEWSYGEEDPAGCDSNVYVSYCGKNIQSWSDASMTEIRKFGTVEEALLQGVELCPICKEKYEIKKWSENRVDWTE